MEDNERVLAEEAVAPPFSELISRWLDEGERLSEAMSTSRVAAASRAETPLRQALLRLRTAVEHHRLSVLVCVGLLPFALFLATHHPTHDGAPVLLVSASARALAPIRTSPAPSPPPTGIHALHELAVVAPQAPPPARRAVVVAPKAPRAVRSVAIAVRKAPPAARPVAVAVPKAPPTVRPVAVAAPQAPPTVRPVAVIAPQVPPAVRPVMLASPKAPHVAVRVAVAGPQAPPTGR